MFRFLNFCKEYSLYIFLAFCLISSSLAVVPFGFQFYVSGLVIGFGYILKCNPYIRTHNSSFLLFLAVCYLSSLLAGLFDYRIFIFSFVLLFVTPIFTSSKAFMFRKRYIEYSLYIFPILSLVSLYCYYAGINMMSMVGDVSWDFSALFWHSMWLGAATGLSNVVIVWMLQQAKNNVQRIIFTVWLMSSLLLSVVSGSRSALAASIIAILYSIYVSSKNIKRFSISIFMIGSLAVISFPFYYESADRMIDKFEYQEDSGGTSRDGVFAMRRLDFEDSPILGVGFGVGHSVITKQKELGRIESGSGWLSILAQTGIVGSMVVVYIICSAYFRVRQRVRNDSYLQLIVPSFVYLCAHSLFEGYILTSGYYLCILFWGILGLMYAYPKWVDKQ